METHVANVSAAGTDLAALSRALEDLPSAIHIVAVDAEGTFPFVAVNRAAEAFMRTPRERVLGTALASITHASRAGRDAIAAHREVAETGRALSYRVLFEREHDEVFVQCALSPLCDAAGNVTHILGIDTEVTADVRSRVEADERFRVAFDDSPIGMVVCDPDGRLLMVNSAFGKLLGYEPAQLHGLTFDSITAPEHVDECRRLFLETVRGERDGFRIEKSYRRADGTTVPAITSVSAARDQDGRMRYTIAHVVDVSDRVEGEAEVRRTRDHAASLLAALRDGVVEMDLEQRIVAANDRFCQLAGLPREEVLGLRPPFPWWDPDDPGYEMSWTDHFFQGPDIATDVSFVHRDGTHLQVSVSVAVVLDADGQPSGWISLVRDVSDRVRAQEELELRARADALVADASTRLLSAPADGVGEVIQDVLGRFCGLVGADHGALWRPDETERRFRRAHSWSHPEIGDTLERSTRAATADEMPWADQQAADPDHRPMFIASLDDLPPEAAAERTALTALGVRSLVSVSIDDDDTLVGVITAAWTRAPAAGVVAATFPALRVLGNSLVAALDRARAEDALRRRRDAEALVAEIARDLVAAKPTEVDESIRRGLERTARFVGAQTASLVRIAEDRRSALRTHLWDPDVHRAGQWRDTTEPVTMWVRDRLRQTDALVARAPDDFPNFLPDLRNRLVEFGVHAIGYLPLRSGGRFLGWVTVVWYADAPEAGSEVALPALRVLGEVYLLALDRARASERLRDSAHSLEWAQATAHIGSWSFEPETDRITWSDELYRILGFEPGAVPATAETFRSVVESARSGGFDFTTLIDEGDTAHRGPRRVVRPNGEERLVVSDIEVERDGDRVVQIRGTVQDVTDSVRADQAVRDSEARFRALVLESGELIQLLDAEGTVLYASPAVERDLGWDVVGTHATDPRRVELVHPEDQPLLLERFVESLEKPRVPVQIEFRVKDRQGKWRNREAMLTNLLDDARVRAVVFNARDITERRELEAQLRESQKMEAVGQLAGGIAHDFNNLLTAITGYATLLIDEVPEGHSMHADLRQIQTAADRAAALVEQLLQFSRRKPSNPTLLDVNDVIESLGGMFGRIIGEHIRLDTVLATDAGLVLADRSQIEQVVMNFVVNARDAMPRGGRLTIESAGVVLDLPDSDRLGLEPGRYLRLDVTDTGTGMEESVAEHVFEPFFTTKGVGKGTGLGLSTVYGIVAQTGGHVAVTSRPGFGTTFTVHLPVAENASDGSGSPTVLLLEDEDTVRVLTRELLERNGYHVIEARDPHAALEAVEGVPALDLLLADVRPPGVAGPDVATALRRRWPGLAVLYVLGRAERGTAPGPAGRTPTPSLAKPFDPDQLLRSVRAALDRSHYR